MTWLFAVWVACHNFEPGKTDTRRWRCTVFRREGGPRASALIEVATAFTYDHWRRNYAWPSVPLETEVDPAKVRHKRDPGRCFVRAGWKPHRCTIASRQLVLRAPEAP